MCRSNFWLRKEACKYWFVSTADGKMLPPMIIFKGTTEKAIQKLRVPEEFIIKTQKKAWMDEQLMHVWVEDIWLKHTKVMLQKLDFENSLLTFDAFSTHKTDEIQGKLIKKDRYFDDFAWLHFKMPADGCPY